MRADEIAVRGTAPPLHRAADESTPGERSTIASLEPVPGNLPDLRRDDLPACRFAERCERATERCRSERPRLDGASAHGVACWHPAAKRRS
jgi:peptide/nickel transport system ATP-binding protein